MTRIAIFLLILLAAVVAFAHLLRRNGMFFPDRFPTGRWDRNAFMVVPTDTQRPVLGVYQLDRGMHDRSQRFVEFEPGRDYQHGLDQTIQPIAAFDYLLDTVLDLHEQLAESQLG